MIPPARQSSTDQRGSWSPARSQFPEAGNRLRRMSILSRMVTSCFRMPTWRMVAATRSTRGQAPTELLRTRSPATSPRCRERFIRSPTASRRDAGLLYLQPSARRCHHAPHRAGWPPSSTGSATRALFAGDPALQDELIAIKRANRATLRAGGAALCVRLDPDSIFDVRSAPPRVQSASCHIMHVI